MSRTVAAPFATVFCLAAMGWAIGDDDARSDADGDQEATAMLVVRVLSAGSSPDQRGTVAIRGELSNPGSTPFRFLGYTLDSFAPPLRKGEVSPIYLIEFRRNGEWEDYPLGWCGFGMGTVDLAPDTKPEFDAYAAGIEDWDAVRIGISPIAASDAEELPPVIWSEPFPRESSEATE